MRCIGLVIYSRENENNKNINIVEKSIEKLKSFLSSKIDKNLIKGIRIDTELEVLLIKLPYTINEIMNLKGIGLKKIQRTILKVCNENSIERCILPKCAPNNFNLKECIRNPFSGNFIYAALLINIIEKIAKRKKINIRELDVAVIHGNNNNMLYYAIERLSPLVKYFTVITKIKEVVEKKSEEILDKTGLSVRITSDFRSGLSGANIIINLEDACNIPKDIRLQQDTTVINFGEETCDDFFKGSFIINGVKIALNYKMSDTIMKEIQGFFSAAEIAEIFIIHKLNLEVNIFKCYADYNIMKNISKLFLQDGYYIEGYV